MPRIRAGEWAISKASDKNGAPVAGAAEPVALIPRRHRLSSQDRFIDWFQSVAPYIHAFRGRAFVIAFGGEVVSDGRFVDLAQDLNLLAALGVKLVLVHGARPQIEEKLKERRRRSRFHDGLRITDDIALACAKEASGRLRVEIEALLSMGLPNSPMAGADIRVASGNFITAKPIGVRGRRGLHVHRRSAQGRGACHPEAARRQRAGAALAARLLADRGSVQPRARGRRRRGRHRAQGREAHLPDGRGRRDRPARRAAARAHRQAGGGAARARRAGRRRRRQYTCRRRCAPASRACRRAHLISGHVDDGLLLELFTRKGVGTMLTPDPIENLRPARLEDIGGVLRLIEPLEADGTLVKRNRDLLEREIGRFIVLEHDRMIIGCAALYPFPEERAGELACLTVHPDFRGGGAGERLLTEIEARARRQKLKRLFVLTTRAEHWFVERGFVEAGIDELPRQKRALYNYQRRSVVLSKRL